ncbi:MAG: histidine kinase N-terminal 7TM domain-containing protein [Halobacteriales archaeon]
MPPRPVPVALALLAGAVSLSVCLYALRLRDRAGARPLAALMAGATVWALGAAAQLTATTPAATAFWWTLSRVGVVVVPAAWFAFALEYTGYGERLTAPVLGLLAVEPVAFLAVAWADPGGLVLRGVSLGTGSAASFAYGPLFWAHVAYSYALIALGTGLVLRLYLTADHLYRGQAAALLVGVSVPWVGNALRLSGIAPPWLYPGSMSMVVAGVAFAAAVSRHRLLDLAPVTREHARDELVASMTDAVIAVDGRDRIVDLNPAAGALTAGSVDLVLGASLEEHFPALAEAVAAVEAPERTEITLKREGLARHYDVRIVPLERRARRSGTLLVLRDVTRLERQRQRLAVLNRVLRHDLRNDMNLVLALAEEIVESADPEVAETARRLRSKGLDIVDLSEKAQRLEETFSSEDVVLERVDLAALAREAAENVRRDHPEATVEVEAPGEAPAYANGLIDSAVDNLVENAIEHNDGDEPTLRITVERDGEFVEFRVADDGPGIPERERSVLGARRETQIHHSSGLGLWLVNWVVTESGGKISFDENEPRGSVVTLALLAADGQ